MNKMQLQQEADKFAAETLAVTDGHALGLQRHARFESLGISGKHYEDFRQRCENSRTQYQSLVETKLEPKA